VLSLIAWRKQMSETKKPHWSFWFVCILALIWSMTGCMNFIMQMYPDMLANYPKSAQSLIATRPIWATLAFAIAVFGSLIADVLLMLRKSIAYYFFLTSLIGIFVTNIHTIQAGYDIKIWVGSLMLLVIGLFLVWYTKTVKQKNWIK
jgi:hypothetical protein